MLILLSGKSFTGKDTICQALIQKHPEFARISIADTMKREFMKVNPGVDLFDRDQKEKHRLELKAFTHQFEFKHWLEQTPYCENCICTDIRTREEIEFIKTKFPTSVVVVVRVCASEDVRKSRGWVFKEGYDDSYLETELDGYPFDLKVRNSTPGCIEFCRDRIYNFVLQYHFIDIGHGFRMTRFPFNGVPFLNTANIFGSWPLRKEYVEKIFEKLEYEFECSSILALESGGYALGMLLAEKLRTRFVVARKPGKLPPPVHSVNYSMEYRSDNQMEIQADSLSIWGKTLIVDDIVVTGGSMRAAQELVEKSGGTVVGFACLAILETDKPLVIDRKRIYTPYLISGTKVRPL